MATVLRKSRHTEVFVFLLKPHTTKKEEKVISCVTHQVQSLRQNKQASAHVRSSVKNIQLCTHTHENIQSEKNVAAKKLGDLTKEVCVLKNRLTQNVNDDPTVA